VSIFDLLFLLSMLATAVTILVLLVLLVRMRFQTVLKVLRIYAVCAVAYILTGVAISYATPQAILSMGDQWCFDDWCLVVNNVSRTPAAQDVDYHVSMRIFSRARRVSQRAKGAWIYLIDGSGRLYPPVSDASDVPLDLLLQPNESVNASRAFRLPQSAHPVGLITGHGGAYCGPMSFLVMGDSACLFKKPKMVRIP
jgi:hypothetical protein